MSADEAAVFKAHDDWASGRSSAARQEIWKSRNLDLIQVSKFTILKARFLAQCGHDFDAATLIREVDACDISSKHNRIKAWTLNTKGFIAYEALQNFGLAKEYYKKSLEVSSGELNEESLLLEISSLWRLSAIELSLGNLSCSNRLLEEAKYKAKDLGRPHMLGVMHLVSGYRHLALGSINNAFDDFLKGLFQVEYETDYRLKFLYAELMLGTVLSQIKSTQPEASFEVINRISALEKIKSILHNGRGYFVTPYPNLGIINPGTLLSGNLVRLKKNPRKGSYSTKKILEKAAAKGLALCVICGSADDLTTDHIMPQNWGGSNFPGNLRILCRSCNSSKRNFFDKKDDDAYLRLTPCFITPLPVA